MDWALAIERNREPLLRIVAALFAMIGFTETGAVERLSRPVYRAVLGVLRPAEAAVRRLIVVAARGMVVKPQQRRPAPAGLAISSKGQGRVSFRLFDPPRRPFDWDHGRRHAGPRPHLTSVSSMLLSIPGFHCSAGLSPLPLHPLPMRMTRLRMTPSMPFPCAAVSPPSRARSKTCRARPGVMRAGRHGLSRRAVRNSRHLCGAVRRRAAGSQPMRSMRSWPDAIGSPGRR